MVDAGQSQGNLDLPGLFQGFAVLLFPVAPGFVSVIGHFGQFSRSEQGRNRDLSAASKVAMAQVLPWA